MPIFSKLFDLLPDGEHLLSLSAEELAGPLLVSLEGGDRINPNIVISYDDLEREIGRSARRIPNLNYPSGRLTEILFALMEGWQHLVCEGFVAPRPAKLAGYTTDRTNTYFVTRKGQKIKTEDDYEAYRKADLLRKHQQHPIIADKVWAIFAQGSYGTAVLEAFKQVEIAVREAGGYTNNDYGTGLMRNAFNVDTGKLTDKNLHESERDGMRNLFLGAISLYKNPSSHHEVEFAPEASAEIIIIASRLLWIVDECKERIANSSI